MRWYQCDAAADQDPKIRVIIRQFRKVGEQLARDFEYPKLAPLVENAGIGALWRTWNFVARHGTFRPGWSLDSAGRPYRVREMADNCGFTVAMFERLISLCARIGHVDQEQWTKKRVVIFPAMAKRADDYTKKKTRTRDSTDAECPDNVRTVSGDHPSTRQDKTVQNTRSRSLDHRSAMIRPELFDLCWGAYPRKVAKQEAMKAWNQADPSEELVRSQMHPAILLHSRLRHWCEEKGKIPHFATWLRGRRWEDEVRDEVDDTNTSAASRLRARVAPKAGGAGATGAADAAKSDAYAALQRQAT